jgi:hypothetical protein
MRFGKRNLIRRMALEEEYFYPLFLRNKFFICRTSLQSAWSMNDQKQSAHDIMEDSIPVAQLT